jgi:hypothetical protein
VCLEKQKLNTLSTPKIPVVRAAELSFLRIGRRSNFLYRRASFIKRMTKSKVLVLLVFVTGTTFSVAGTTGSDAQPTTDNATGTTMATQDNMTASAGNMTDANITQSGKISGCGTECF